MRRFFLLFTIYIALLLAPEMHAQYVWKETNRAITEQAINNPRTTEGIAVYRQSGMLIVKTPVKTSIRVLTILGQTISAVAVNPGTYELELNTHGIFIVRIGDNAFRLTL